MATTEANTELGRQIVEDAKRYVLYSWSTQSAINPIPVERGTPRLIVSAGPQSGPILVRLGFEPIGTVRLLRQRVA